MTQDQDPIPTVLRTGLGALDTILGIGGWPRGRLVEVYGDGFGRDEVALHTIGVAQSSGSAGAITIVGADWPHFEVRGTELGIDMRRIAFVPVSTVEAALNTVGDLLVRPPPVVVFDLTSLPKDARTARLLSHGFRTLTARASWTDALVIVLNDVTWGRDGTWATTGNESTGNATKFYASIRVEVRKLEDLHSEYGALMGERVRLKVVKNKLAVPFRTAEITLAYGRGLLTPLPEDHHV